MVLVKTTGQIEARIEICLLHYLMKNPELDLVISNEDSEQSLRFLTLDADEHGALSPAEFSVVIDRFL